ncbi:hypothetical protein DAPPUDRAFT_247541 [Daphnia pulex]|uniref:Uncharacterized protein n=1 Tax=Daphnia pulex TaxID=6669 RepID=E9GSN1_DAPPU|nr:hypothetical protein DAPPUDRAFT_247541 [Daphnia pulex]|eukprot:EFX77458.1 hypothetical protein DAPPUDRAFT_247541 [Daphnia pulex]
MKSVGLIVSLSLLSLLVVVSKAWFLNLKSGKSDTEAKVTWSDEPDLQKSSWLCSVSFVLSKIRQNPFVAAAYAAPVQVPETVVAGQTWVMQYAGAGQAVAAT